MKKIISSILCLAMMLSMSTVAFAQTNDFLLTYSNEPSYEITIPDSSNIDVSTGKGTIDIAVSDANLAEGTMVAITASSSNYANDSWNLVNIKDNTDKIAYTIGTTDGGNDISSGDRVVATENASNVTLYVTVSDTSKVGTFSDTITFTSEMVEEMVSFIFDATEYVVADGTCWEDFIQIINQNPELSYKINISSNKMYGYFKSDFTSLGSICADGGYGDMILATDVIVPGNYGFAFSNWEEDM